MESELWCALGGVILGPLFAQCSRVMADRNLTFADVPAAYRRPGWRGALCSVLGAVLFAVAGAKWGGTFALAGHLVLVSVLLVESVIDAERYLIPNRVVFPGFVAALVLLGGASVATDQLRPFVLALIGAVICFLVLFATHLAYPSGMGLGDVKLALVLGLFLGWAAPGVGGVLLLVLYCLLFGSLIGSVVGLGKLAIQRGRGSRHFPFGPPLAVGTLAALMIAPSLIR